MPLRQVRQPVGVLVGVRLWVLTLLAALLVGCGEGGDGTIKPSGDTKSPLATSGEKTK